MLSDGELRYAATDDGQIAFRRLPGTGPLEFVFMLDGWFAMESLYEDRGMARLLDGLRELGDLVVYDRLGAGLSDPITDWSDWTYRKMAPHVCAVAETAGYSDAVVIAEMWGSPVAAMAAESCDAIRQTVLFEPYNPWAWDVIGHEWLTSLADHMADEADPAYTLAPERADDARFRAWLNRSWRMALSPTISHRLFVAMVPEQRDQIRRAYESLEVPSLLIRREQQPLINASDLTDADDRIDAAERAVVPGRDMFLCGNGVEPILAEIARFTASEQHPPGVGRTVEALLYTDISGSTAAARAAGDDVWNATIDAHDEVTERVVFGQGGRVVKTTGDGALSLLPSATAAVQAALHLRTKLDELGLTVRAGIHVGDVEAKGTDLEGLSINVAARTMDAADPGDVLMTEAARLSMLGGRHEPEPVPLARFKGLDGDWQLYRI